MWMIQINITHTIHPAGTLFIPQEGGFHGYE